MNTPATAVRRYCTSVIDMVIVCGIVLAILVPIVESSPAG